MAHEPVPAQLTDRESYEHQDLVDRVPGRLCNLLGWMRQSIAVAHGAGTRRQRPCAGDSRDVRIHEASQIW